MLLPAAPLQNPNGGERIGIKTDGGEKNTVLPGHGVQIGDLPRVCLRGHVDRVGRLRQSRYGRLLYQGCPQELAFASYFLAVDPFFSKGKLRRATRLIGCETRNGLGAPGSCWYLRCRPRVLCGCQFVPARAILRRTCYCSFLCAVTTETPACREPAAAAHTGRVNRAGVNTYVPALIDGGPHVHR